MFGIRRWRATRKTLSVSLALAMTLSLWGCGGSPSPSVPIVKPETRVATKSKPVKLSGRVSEASPPEVIQQLREVLDQYQPQVSIVAPKPNELLQDNTVSVQLRVKDLPIFKDEKLGLGPHLHVFLDDQPYQAVYDVSQPLVLKDLAPGTHTIRVFAGRPWHESFKNDGAYAQTTFHIFTKTPNNNPKSDLPLLTYSRPQGSYGAEPILLDFYLTNAPLHFVAQEDAKDDVADWQVRVTVNGDSFDLDRWQPVYLRGFKPGKNWVQVEYVDEKGNPVPNVYNNTARIFTYEPNGQDTLSKLVRGELSFAQAKGIVDPNYKPEAQPAPIETPKPIETPEVTPVPVVPVPKAEETPAEPETPPVKAEEKVPETVPAPVEEAKPKGGFFNRFKRPTPSAAPSLEPSSAPIPPELPTSAPAETLEPEATPEDSIVPKAEEVPKVESTPEVKPSPKGGLFDRFKGLAPKPASEESPSPAPIPTESPASEPEATKEEAPTVPEEEIVPEVEATPEAKPAPQGGFFNRFKGLVPKPAPVVPSPVPVPAELPASEPEATEEEAKPEVETTPEAKPATQDGLFDRFKGLAPKPAPIAPTPSPIPAELPVSEPEVAPEASKEEAEPKVEVTPEAKPSPQGGFFNRFKLPAAKPSPSPAPIESPTPVSVPKDEEVPEAQASPESESPKGGLFDRFKRPETLPTPNVSPTPLPTELTAPETEPSAEPVPEVAKPEVKEAPKPSLFDRFKPKSTIAPSPSPAESPSPIEVEPTEPEVKEAPQSGLFDRFKTPIAPSVESSSPVEVKPAEPEPEAIEEPKPEAKEAPKSSFFDRFKSLQPKPAPSVAPAIPESAPESEDTIAPSEEPKPSEPAVKEAPKVNLFERFKSPTVKPSAPAESAPVEIPQSEETPKAEESEGQPASSTPGFAPQSELERRLGIPVKPPVAAPAKQIARPQPTPAAKPPASSFRFGAPKSSDSLFKRESNPFLRSAKSSAPEPVETPAASEAPSVESTSEGVPVE